MTDSPLDDNGQRMVSGFGTLHADTSKQEHDVEDLEQQVIDDQTKQQQNLVEQMKNKVRVVAERLIILPCIGHMMYFKSCNVNLTKALTAYHLETE